MKPPLKSTLVKLLGRRFPKTGNAEEILKNSLADKKSRIMCGIFFTLMQSIDT
jgi:hypothetical protein